MNSPKTQSCVTQTETIAIGSGTIAYEVVGSGPLVVLSHGVADNRSSFRHLVPLLAAAGYRVANVDLRGHGQSSTGWDSYNHADTASDLMAVIEKLGGPAVIVAQSFSGGAATIAAATNPDTVRALVEIDPFTRPAKVGVAALLTNSHNYLRGSLLLGRFLLTGSVKTWAKYLDVAYPGLKPADWDSYLTKLEANLAEPGRVKAAQKMCGASATLKQAATQLPDVRCPVLVLIGSHDSDFPDPEAEAVGIVGLLPNGLGRYQMIDKAGHYPQAQYPQQVADAILPFLATVNAA